MAQIIDLGKIRFNWAGLYSNSAEYSYNDLVKYGPNLYAYVNNTATTGNVPTNETYWFLVTEGIDYRGNYTSGTLYYRNDVVIDGTSTYIVLTQHTATSSVAEGNANLEVIALGQDGLPNQTGQTNQVLSTNGVNADWVDTVYLSKSYIGNAQGQGGANFETVADLTDVMGVFSGATSDFAQLVVVNTNDNENSSADVIVYSANGTNDSGWIDLGITSVNFDAEVFGITGPNDGYIFMSGPRSEVIDVVSLLVAGGVATVTTGSDHEFLLGDVVRITGVHAEIDGVVTISAVTETNKFSFPTTAPTQSDTAVLPFGNVFRPFGGGNLVLATDLTGTDNKIVFAAGGFASGTTQMEIVPDQRVFIDINTDSLDSNSGALVVNGGAGFNGAVSVDGLVRIEGLTYVGAGAETFESAADLTNAKVVVVVEGDPYAQVAIHNPTSTSSGDVIIYADNGDDLSGWIDVGITGSEFEQAEFGLTGPNDGYVFFEAPEGTTGKGNLVIATGDKGTENKIIIAAGGFATGTEQVTITPDVNVHIEIDTPSTSPNTGALTIVGGVGIVGDVNIQGSITFGGTGTEVSTENLSVEAAMIYVGSGNEGDSLDLGIVAEYDSSGTKYSGLVRDASDGLFKLFQDATTKPTTTVNFAEVGLTYASLQVAALTVGANPSSALQVTPKQYVDAVQASLEIGQLMGAY